MRNDSIRLLALTLLALGCDDGRSTAPAPPPAPGTMAVVSGDNQPGVYGEFLAQPFAVRVTDAAGDAVVGAQVTWGVTFGQGEFASLPGQPLSRPVSHTDADGVASVYFQPTWPGPSVITAAVGTVAASPATFHVSGAPVVPVRFGPLFDCTPSDPSRFDEPQEPIAVGNVVLMEYRDFLSPECTARVVSRAVPAGGTPFDSGILSPGDRFWFVLDAPGDWQYGDVINSGGGSVSVR